MNRNIIMTSQSKYKKTKDAAEYCGSAKSTFDKIRITGEGPPFIKRGKSVVYDINDLDAWMQSMRRTSTSDLGGSHDL